MKERGKEARVERRRARDMRETVGRKIRKEVRKNELSERKRVEKELSVPIGREEGKKWLLGLVPQ